MYVIINLNPQRDRYYSAKSGGDYIKAPGSREYHTNLDRATRFPTVERATKAAYDMQTIHRNIVRRPESHSFAEDYGMTKDTTPMLTVCELVCEVVTLSDDDRDAQVKFIAENC